MNASSLTIRQSRVALRAPRLSPAGLALVLLIHAAAFWLLWRMNVIQLPAPLAELSVRILPPTAVTKPPEPAPTPPKPRPIEKRPRPVPEPVQLAAPADSPAPSPVVVPLPPPVIAAPPPVAAPPAPQPAPVAQPRFDADYLDNPKPPYPSLSRRMGEEGRVLLRAHIDAAGLPREVLLATSSGSERLDRSALDTVRRWKFVPAKRGDEAVAAWVLVPIVFSLKE
jgi:periplasmic protein TonB